MIGHSVGPYRIVSELGSGGMGIVYRAEGPEGPVALKVVHAHLAEDESQVRRFLREADLGRRVRHANVANLLDAGEAEFGGKRRPWIALEFVKGQTLRALLDEMDRVPEQLCRHLGREILRGLAAVHEAGVVHRDLKPENVLVTPAHEVKLTDLGLARHVGGKSSDSGVFVGTPAYAAPEQFGAPRDVDARADLYSLGVVLYELASGNVPFPGKDLRSMALRVTREPPRPLGEANPQVSPFLEEFVHRLLAKTPTARFANAAAALKTLEQGENSDWWNDRTCELRISTHRPLRRIRVARDTALHGREAELAKLRDAWTKVKQGHGQVVLVEGEAGIGKSRLADEWVGTLERQGEDVEFLIGGWPPGGAATASGAFTDALREHLEGEDLETYLADALPETPALVASFAATLRGDAPPPGATVLSRDALQTLFVQLVRHLGRRRPTVLVAEDLHFAPDDGRALFAALATAIPDHPVLLIGTLRPGPVDAWAAEIARLQHATRVPLSRLGARELVRLLTDALRSEHLAEELSAQFALKSDGNPYFVFEILRGLREGKLIAKRPDGSWHTTQVVREIRIPESVRELIETRLRELGDDDLEILRVAACAGFAFDPLLIGAVVGLSTLPLLKRLGAIEMRHHLVRSVGRVYEFDHHQVQEVLVAGLSELHRETYHASLGDALEAREGTASKEQTSLDGALCATLAEHFLRGGRGARALRYLDRAIDRLVSQHAVAASVSLMDLALAAPGLFEGKERVALLLRKLKMLDRDARRDEQRKTAEEAIALADATGDPALRARARIGFGTLTYSLGMSGRDAKWALVEAVGIAKSAGLLEVEGEAEHCLGSLCFNAGRSIEARPHWERALAIGIEIGHKGIEAGAAGALGHAFLSEGRADEACAAFERHRTLAREMGDAYGEQVAINNLGMTHTHMGDFDRAIELHRLQVEKCRALGARRMETIGYVSLGIVYAQLGHFLEARAHYERNLQMSREIGDRLGESVAHVNIGYLELSLGEFERARASLLEATAVAQALGARKPYGYGQYGLAHLHDELDESAEAQRWYLAAIATREDAGDRTGVASTQVQLGALLARLGRVDEGLERIRGGFTELAAMTYPHLAATAACRLAALGALPADEARRRLEAAAPRFPRRDLMECRLLLFQATGDADQLVAARELLDRIVSQAPPESREAMTKRVRVHREILAGAAINSGETRTV